MNSYKRFDKKYSDIVNYLVHGIIPEQCVNKSNLLRIFMLKCKSYFINRSKLYYRRNDQKGYTAVEVIADKKRQQSLIARAHSGSFDNNGNNKSAESGEDSIHRGIRATCKLVTDRFYFDNIRGKVEKYLKKCTICQGLNIPLMQTSRIRSPLAETTPGYQNQDASSSGSEAGSWSCSGDLQQDEVDGLMDLMDPSSRAASNTNKRRPNETEDKEWVFQQTTLKMVATIETKIKRCYSHSKDKDRLFLMSLITELERLDEPLKTDFKVSCLTKMNKLTKQQRDEKEAKQSLAVKLQQEKDQREAVGSPKLSNQNPENGKPPTFEELQVDEFHTKIEIHDIKLEPVDGDFES